MTAENLQRLETTGSKMERMVEEGEGVVMHASNGESVMMGRMEGGAGIDLSLPITSTYLRRMRGLSCEPKVKALLSSCQHLFLLFFCYPINIAFHQPSIRSKIQFTSNIR